MFTWSCNRAPETYFTILSRYLFKWLTLATISSGLEKLWKVLCDKRFSLHHVEVVIIMRSHPPISSLPLDPNTYLVLLIDNLVFIEELWELHN